MLKRLLLEDNHEWYQITETLIEQNKNLKVPMVNDTTTLHQFNVNLSELFTEVSYYFAKARRNKDAIERIIENTLKDYYKGPNDTARRAAGLQLAQNYPIPDDIQDYFSTKTVNLFELQDQINGYYYALDAIIKSLHMKSGAKITSNSLLNLEKTLVPN